MSELFKLFIGLACITVLAAGLGLVNLQEYGLGGVQKELQPVLSDIKAATDYFQGEFLDDMQDLFEKLKAR